MTQLHAGQPVGRLDGTLAKRATLAGTTWAVASFVLNAAVFKTSPAGAVDDLFDDPWPAVTALVIEFAAAMQTVSLSERAKTAFGQDRAAGLLSRLAVTAGLTVGAALWLSWTFAAEPSPEFDLRNIAQASDIPRELGAVISGFFAGWALVSLCLLPAALRHARSRQEMIQRLRLSGTKYDGVLTQVRFHGAWLRDTAVFTVEVAYSADGREQALSAHMRTTPARVPVAGTRMVVITDGAGSEHLELDCSTVVAFEPDDGRYSPAE